MPGHTIAVPLNQAMALLCRVLLHEKLRVLLECTPDGKHLRQRRAVSLQPVNGVADGLQQLNDNRQRLPEVCVCKVTTLDSSAPACRMDQTGSTRSYPTSTTVRCRKERKAQRPEKDRTKQQKT
eukprot:346449-Chlamydomonas_euryale.AAC.1